MSLERIWHAIKAPKDIAETELLALEEGIENFVNETRMLHQKTTVTIEESTRRLQQEDLGMESIIYRGPRIASN